MGEKHKGKLKIIIAFAILFLVVTILLVLVFYAGKKSYTVKFELNGGTLISGSLEQTITRGQDATPPIVVKDGAYLLRWSSSVRQVTKDMVIEAIWEYETTPGVIYQTEENQNYAEISGSFEYLRGEIYLGAYYGDKKILGICQNAFSGREGITKIFLLDGIIYIGTEAFSDCSSLTEIEIPETVTHIGAGAFKGCTSLERVVLNTGITELGAGAFEGCTSLKEIVLPNGIINIEENTFLGCTALPEITIPKSVEKIGANAFNGCTSLTNVTFSEGLKEMERGAFDGCIGLTTITLPRSLVTIKTGAFNGCDNLTIKTRNLVSIEPDGWEEGWEGSAKVELIGNSIIIRPPFKYETDKGWQ